jgi:hypothetical protein
LRRGSRGWLGSFARWAGSGKETTAAERRVLVEELLDGLAMYPDHLEVTVKAPRLDVRAKRLVFGPGRWQFYGVGGGI